MADTGSQNSGEGGEIAEENAVASEVSGDKQGDPPHVQSEEDQSEPLDVTANESGFANPLVAEGQSGAPAVSENPVTPPSSVETPESGAGAANSEEAPALPSTVRRVSFQHESDVVMILPPSSSREERYTPLAERSSIDSLQVPGSRYTPSTSSSPTPSLPLPEQFSMPRRLLGRRRNSEWVFRPLKLKFKVKELEELYGNYIYRQQQSLLCTACLIMFSLSLMIFITFLANKKVSVSYGNV